MHRKIAVLLLSLLTLALMPLSARAEISPGWGVSERIRYEYWKNWKDMDNGQLDNRNFIRFRTSLWGELKADKKFSLFAKLTDEFRAHTYFGGTSSSFPDKTASKKGYHFDINEVVFDNLYFDYNTFFGLPVDLRLGRQDLLTYGEGFLIYEGTPGDGSRTYYFNAVRASLCADDKNTLDFIYINDPRDEEFLPAINRAKFVQVSRPTLDKVPQSLNTTDEQAGLLYWKNKSVKNLALDGYYIYKREGWEGGTGLQAQKGKINTWGGMAKYDIADWTFKGQLAYQFGKYGANDRQGIGGYGYIERGLKDKLFKPYLTLGYIYLSGDRRRTNKIEAWDPLFSRYTWISDIYSMSMNAETGITYYWTNLSILRATMALKLAEKIKLTFGYNFLRANEQVAASAIFSGRGKTKGHLPQMKLEYAFNKNVNSFFQIEYLIPGNFYKDRDPGIFLRTELSIKF